jgi:hypothetical protein
MTGIGDDMPASAGLATATSYPIRYGHDAGLGGWWLMRGFSTVS